MGYDAKIILKAPYGLLNIRAKDEVCASLAASLGFDLPRQANTSVTKNNISALWLGPDEWLIKTHDGDETGLAAQLKQQTQHQHVAVTQMSDCYIVLEVSGAEARQVLCQGISIDLHPHHFRPGDCTRAGLAKTSALIHQLNDIPSYDIYVLRSYANYAQAWLNKAKGT